MHIPVHSKKRHWSNRPQYICSDFIVKDSITGWKSVFLFLIFSAADKRPTKPKKYACQQLWYGALNFSLRWLMLCFGPIRHLLTPKFSYFYFMRETCRMKVLESDVEEYSSVEYSWLLMVCRCCWTCGSNTRHSMFLFKRKHGALHFIY